MNCSRIICLLLLGLALAAPVAGDTTVSIVSASPGTLFINGQPMAAVGPTAVSRVTLRNPGRYVIDVVGPGGVVLHREECQVQAGIDLHQEIQCGNPPAAYPQLGGPPAMPAYQPLPVAPTGAYPPTADTYPPAYVSGQPSYEAVLAEEEARRQREAERGAARQTLIHLLGTEMRNGVSESEKQRDRFRLLGGDLWRSLFKRR